MAGQDHGRITRALMICAALASAASSSPVAQSRTYRSGIELVPLTVTVTNRAGEYVKGLTRSDFTVFENGVPQALTFFAAGTVPIDLALVIDTSSSMMTAMPLVRAAATGLVQALGDDDRVAVFAANRSVAMPQGFTTDRAAISSAIQAQSARGATAVYDAVYIALQELARQRRHETEVRRQVLVLLSDGLDNASHVSAEEVADRARRVGASVYAIALTNPAEAHLAQNRDRARAAFDLKALVSDSGGRLFHSPSSRELPKIYGAIANELANQYDLAYVPPGPADDGSFRRVAVRVSADQAVARTRSGYYAAR